MHICGWKGQMSDRDMQYVKARFGHVCSHIDQQSHLDRSVFSSTFLFFQCSPTIQNALSECAEAEVEKCSTFQKL